MVTISETSSGRRGFTLIELLVVVAVVGLLVAIILPAVQAARAAARRMSCASNLKQLGLAALNYESTYNVFPARSSRVGSQFAALLPYLEQAALFSSINTSGIMVTLPAGMNTTVANTRLSVLLCPADNPAVRPTAPTNYAGNAGTGFQTGVSENGMFVKGGATMASVRDGGLHTALFAEWVVGDPGIRDNPPMMDRRTCVFKTPWFGGDQRLERFASYCNNNVDASNIIIWEVKGETWLRGEMGAARYNHIVVVNGSSCINGGYVPDGAWTAGSWHAGIAQVGFVDGHVQSIRETIGPMNWRAMGTRAGDEIMDGIGF
ncbi:DUF1559 family PulG-like putative transporter [Paludisphaera mucosa]|uniref:DUF1559 domain-containing protein n=1 Tax=Paludisphaera mucosa TaxID=3030827 RepID=A0ABT6FCH7_9BACT|nr:DUF1559 domain-containing protein [Paludisphaera mucosa]MDG3005295.1 DUF1559 domain-containing protein [Paludisphaera mucosa]